MKCLLIVVLTPGVFLSLIRCNSKRQENPGFRTTIDRHFRPERPRPGRKGRKAPPNAIAPISENAVVEEQPEASAVNLQDRADTLQTDSLQDDDDTLQTDELICLHRVFFILQTVCLQSVCCILLNSDEDSVSDPCRAADARLGAYGAEANSPYVKRCQQGSYGERFPGGPHLVC